MSLIILSAVAGFIGGATIGLIVALYFIREADANWHREVNRLNQEARTGFKHDRGAAS